MKIILLRHGESEEKGLTEEGKQKCLKTAEFMKNNRIEINKCIN
jgi:phosphohistidine phosphatase SixA